MAPCFCVSLPGQAGLAVNHGPIFQGSVAVDLDGSEAAENHFFSGPDWCVFLSLMDFPLERWHPAAIRAIFVAVGSLAEIDPLCLERRDINSLRIVLELNNPARVPRELHIIGPDGEGGVARLSSLFVWQCDEALDAFGVSTPFFGPPPPPPPAALPPLPPFFGSAPLALPPPAHQGGPPQQQKQQPNNFGSYDNHFNLSPANPRLPVFATFFFGPIRGAPLAPIPALPIIFPALPDNDHDALPPPPPSLPEMAYLEATPTHRRPPAPSRASAHLAAKESASFVSMADKVVQLKALQNALEPCSLKLKAQVQKSGVLRKGMSIASATLRKLVSAAGLGHAGAKAAVTAAPE